MKRSGHRQDHRFRPWAETVEARELLSGGGLPPGLKPILLNPVGYPAQRPNTPVLPYGATNNLATFIDPTVKILNGQHVIGGLQSFIGPYVLLDGSAGFIKFGTRSNILDNAVIIATPNHHAPTNIVLIGDNVSIGFGATIFGPSQVGAYNDAALPTSVGPNALIDGATIEPGAIVGALARVGPGVIVPGDVRVLPGVNITTDAEASDPALGKVVKQTATDQSNLVKSLSDYVALAAGYATLYQGDKATGSSIGIPASVSNVFNGNLANVEGASPEPGSPTVKFEPPGPIGPQFPSPNFGEVQGLLPNFPARVTGLAVFFDRAHRVARHLGHHNAIRADQGQPLTFASSIQTGNSVSIHSPIQGQVIMGLNVQIGSGAVILAGPRSKATTLMAIGDNVTIGPGAVIDRSDLGTAVVIGARSFISNSKLAAGTVIPPGTIMVDNKVVGTIQW